jgi:uroporphyrinogen decarboxylase
MEKDMNKRDLVLDLLDSSKAPVYIPAGFFLHFDPAFQRGQNAVDKHMEFFHDTGMDFVKIQYEQGFPQINEIQKPQDWAGMPSYGLDFYEEQLKVVEGLVKAAKHEALVVITLYSPFMCAVHTTSDALVTQHINENPDAVKLGMEAITASLLRFVKACIHLGVDGFYTSTQGGEAGRLTNPARFDQCIRPYDLALMNEASSACPFNILHICDYQRSYDDISRFVDYPGQVVNCSLEVGGRMLSAKQVAHMFGRPYMGGLMRKGVIASGTRQEIRAAVKTAIADSPERFILAADCTVPGETPWENLRTAIETAHEGR